MKNNSSSITVKDVRVKEQDHKKVQVTVTIRQGELEKVNTGAVSGDFCVSFFDAVSQCINQKITSLVHHFDQSRDYCTLEMTQQCHVCVSIGKLKLHGNGEDKDPKVAFEKAALQAINQFLVEQQEDGRQVA